MSNSDIVFAGLTQIIKKKLLHPVFGLWKTSLYNDLRKELERVKKSTLEREAIKLQTYFSG